MIGDNMSSGMSTPSQGIGNLGAFSSNTVGQSLSSGNTTTRPPSEFEREANRLRLSIEHAQQCITELAQKLSPILRPMSELPKNSEKSASPITAHGIFLAKQGDNVEMINDAFHQILNALEI